MSVANTLRVALPHLNVVQKATPLLCEHRLAWRAYERQVRDGVIYEPRFEPRTSYLPYYAAQPVAPHIAGLRTSGFRAASLWGASVAVSLLRNEAPNFTLYYNLYIKHQVPVPRVTATCVGNAGDDAGKKSLWQQVLPYLPYAPLTFGAWELAFGSGLAEAAVPYRGPHQYAWYETVRRKGIVGLGIQGLTHAADARAGSTLEAAYLGAACLLTVINQVPRAVGAVLVGAVAGVGSVFGIAYEVFACLATRVTRHGAPHSMREALALQREHTRAHMRELDDTALPAPLIDALWRGRTAFEPNVNYWSNVTQAAADLVEHCTDPRLALFLRAPRRWESVFGQAGAPPGAFPPPAAGPPPGPDNVPLAGEAGQGPQNVHGRGRDEATRRSVARLLSADPLSDADVVNTLEEIDVALATASAVFRARRHPSGRALWEAAKMMLSPELNGGVFQFYPAIKDPRSTYNVDGHGIVPVRKIAAVIWRAIPEAVREERREAYFSALADAVDEQSHRLCQGGQVQRLALRLQGFVPGVQIEAYDAPVPVAQFVTVVTQRIDGRIDGDDAVAVRAAYDAAYLEGCAIYRGVAREELRNQLCACAQALYEVMWAPPPDGRQ